MHLKKHHEAIIKDTDIHFYFCICFGQSDSLIIGEYTFVEQKGIHVVPGLSDVDFHPTSYISHIDITITNSLLLDNNHNAVLQIDTTSAGQFGFIKPELKWHGKWEIINDTLVIKFTASSTLWPFYFVEEKITPTIEKMTNQIIFMFVIKTYNNRIYGLEFVNNESSITYRKE